VVGESSFVNSLTQIDPLGATIIALCIIVVWTRTVHGGSTSLRSLP
jgi:hypothetical protein